MILRPGEREEVQRLFIADGSPPTACRPGEEQCVSASQPTFQAAMREQVGFPQ